MGRANQLRITEMDQRFGGREQRVCWRSRFQAFLIPGPSRWSQVASLECEGSLVSEVIRTIYYKDSRPTENFSCMYASRQSKAMPSLKLICINEQSPWFPFLWCVRRGDLFLPCSRWDSWLMNHHLREACLCTVTLQMGANQKTFIISLKWWHRLLISKIISSLCATSWGFCRVVWVGVGWVSVLVLYVRRCGYLGQVWHILILPVKQERRLSEMTESEMQVSGRNWKEELGTRARSRKAGNSGAGVWGEREGGEKDKAKCIWITLGF